MDALVNLNPLIPTLVVYSIDFFITVLTAAICAWMQTPRKSWICWIYAFSAGTLIATGTIGMTYEALERSQQKGTWSQLYPWIPVACGMIMGVVSLQVTVVLVIWLQKRRNVPAKPQGEHRFVFNDNQDNGNDDDDEIQTPRVALPHQRTLIPMPLENWIHIHRPQPIGRDALATAAAARAWISPDENQFRQSMVIFCSLILQQLPEGIMLGAAFANVIAIDIADEDARRRAFRVAIGISIGSWITTVGEAIAMVIPLKREHVHEGKIMAFVFAGMFMEGVGAVAACVLLTHVEALLPFILSAVAGTMIYSVMTEMIPAASEHNPKIISNILMMAGFISMIVFIHMFG